SGGEDSKSLQALIYQHLEATESKKAKEILAQWETASKKFWKVVPHPPVSVLPPAQPASSISAPQTTPAKT
ncbi:MAG: hypothetical protein O2804_01850, partial [Verrucomicrobia bacterium]|nr:hypothetical protein [Verrucomicrobiota bacterium]